MSNNIKLIGQLTIVKKLHFEVARHAERLLDAIIMQDKNEIAICSDGYLQATEALKEMNLGTELETENPILSQYQKS